MNIETVSAPTHAELVEEFKLISQSTYKGIRGVWCLKASRRGPTVGITIHTHGNEPSGLAALWYMRHKFHLWDKLCCGRVFFVLNNIRATKKYLETRAASSAALKKLDTRFADTNMNRLPANLSKLIGDSRYEIKRARELLPVWREFTIAMDIHSAKQKTPPMIIQVESGEDIERLTRDFPIGIIISRITEYQLRKPAIAFYGDPGKRIPSVGIEAGSHENKRAFAVAIACVKLLLQASGVIENVPVRRRSRRRRTYTVGWSVVFPDDSWQLTKVFRMFEPVRKGRVLAVGSENRRIRAPFTGVIIFGSPTKKPVKLEDEVLFLTRTNRA